MQVNHGKAAPLKRVKPGDGVVYYSPTQTLGGKERLQAFTAVGTVRCGAPYQGDMGGGLLAFRRDVDWAEAEETPIHPLLDKLDFTTGQRNWGYRFRYGLFAIEEADFRLIAKAMSVSE